MVVVAEVLGRIIIFSLVGVLARANVPFTIVFPSKTSSGVCVLVFLPLQFWCRTCGLSNH